MRVWSEVSKGRVGEQRGKEGRGEETKQGEERKEERGGKVGEKWRKGENGRSLEVQ